MTRHGVPLRQVLRPARLRASARVLADNTFPIKKVRFEAPRDLRNRTISARFDRNNLGRVVVYFKGERMGDALPVDFLANDRPPKGAEK